MPRLLLDTDLTAFISETSELWERMEEQNTAMANMALKNHTHSTSQISGLDGQLNNKANVSVTNDLSTRMIQAENQLSAHSLQIAALNAWRSAKSPYMGRLTLAASALNISLLGLGVNVAGAGLIDKVNEIIAYINNKMAPAMESKEITQAA